MRRELQSVPLPHEAEAEERARQIVLRAFAEREPLPQMPRARRVRPAAIAVAGIAAAVVAVAVSPAGSELVHSVRQAVGVEHAAPALTRLPAPGALLVTAGTSPWIVHEDGSKRLLGRYSEASWSPHGLFVAVTRRHELLAVDPKGTIRWSLGRTGPITLPRWSPDGYRIAYFDGNALWIVAGDGTGDKLLAAQATDVPGAWRPSDTNEHVLAYSAAGRLELVDVDSGRVIARTPLVGAPQTLLWSKDGERLAVVSPWRIEVFDHNGTPLARISLVRRAGAASFVPGTHRLTVVLRGTRSDAVTFDLDHPRRPPAEVFSGSGEFSSLAWSPDARWLLVAWPTANQWLFVPSGPGKVVAVANVAAQFATSRRPATPLVDGWCC